ncbi:MAG: hypothetical protein JXR03_01555 [Cyclobacteriaceae bacterium]
MALPSSPPIDLDEVYQYATTIGYSGGRSLVDLLNWSGWGASLSTDADSLLDFLGLRHSISLTLDFSVTNNSGVYLALDIYKGVFEARAPVGNSLIMPARYLNKITPDNNDPQTWYLEWSTTFQNVGAYALENGTTLAIAQASFSNSNAPYLLDKIRFGIVLRNIDVGRNFEALIGGVTSIYPSNVNENAGGVFVTFEDYYLHHASSASLNISITIT